MMLYDIFDQEQEITIPFLFGQKIIYPDVVEPISKTEKIDDEPSEPTEGVMLSSSQITLLQKFIRAMKYGYLTEEEKQLLRYKRAVLP